MCLITQLHNAVAQTQNLSIENTVVAAFANKKDFLTFFKKILAFAILMTLSKEISRHSSLKMKMKKGRRQLDMHMTLNL